MKLEATLIIDKTSTEDLNSFEELKSYINYARAFATIQNIDFDAMLGENFVCKQTETDNEIIINIQMADVPTADGGKNESLNENDNIQITMDGMVN